MTKMSYRPYRRGEVGKVSHTVTCPRPTCLALITVTTEVGVSRTLKRLTRLIGPFKFCPVCGEAFQVTPLGGVIAFR